MILLKTKNCTKYCLYNTPLLLISYLQNKGMFGYRLSCWNWKIIAESTVDKSKS